MVIRESRKEDIFDIEKVHMQAFGEQEGPTIVELVHNLFKDNSAVPLFSLVALEDEKIVGHILFTKASVKGSNISAQILAPLAVLPEYQNKGIGGKLIRLGLESLRKQGVKIVLVLGYPKYYSRFGFKMNAKKLGFEAPYPIEEKNNDAWMVQELKTGLLGDFVGQIKCADAMDKQAYWTE